MFFTSRSFERKVLYLCITKKKNLNQQTNGSYLRFKKEPLDCLGKEALEVRMMEVLLELKGGV